MTETGNVVPMLPQSSQRSVAISEGKPSAEWLTRIVTAMLSIYYQPTEAEEVVQLQLALWEEALSDLPARAIELAIKQRLRSPSRSRPVPGEIRELAQGFVNYGRPGGAPAETPGRPFGPGPDLSAEERERMAAALSQLARDLGLKPKTLAECSALHRIIETAADVCGVTVAHVQGRTKAEMPKMARLLAYRACRMHTGATLVEIGRMCGAKDHTTVLSGIRQADDRVAHDPAWTEAAAEIDRRLVAE